MTFIQHFFEKQLIAKGRVQLFHNRYENRQVKEMYVHVTIHYSHYAEDGYRLGVPLTEPEKQCFGWHFW